MHIILAYLSGKLGVILSRVWGYSAPNKTKKTTPIRQIITNVVL